MTNKLKVVSATAALVAATLAEVTKHKMPEIEFRSMPKHVEQRNSLLTEMETLVNSAKTESRALSDDEIKKYDDLKKQVEALNKTIEVINEQRALGDDKKDITEEPENRSQEEVEMRSFANFIRGVVEQRSEVNLTKGANGALIPKSIAKKIIDKVKDISPLFERATRYNVKGELSIPYYDESTSSITVGYATEFVDLEGSAFKTGSIELKGFLVGALTKISKSLVNNTDFDLVNYVVEKMAEAFALFFDTELIQGTTDKILGLRGVTQSKTAASAVAITADELIDVQEKLPDLYQPNAIWIMNKTTRTAIRKLKDGQGQYLLNKDAQAKWGYTLFGKDVYTSAAVDEIGATKTPIYYGDPSGLAVKVAEDVEIQVLLEKYATQHAIGVVGWAELDSKVENAQKLAKLVMPAAQG